MTLLYGSSSHTLYSLALIGGSVGAFFVLFWLFSFLRLSTLAFQFHEIITYPNYFACLFFFFTVTVPLDAFFHWVVSASRDADETQRKQKKKEDRKKFVKGLDPNKLAPLHRRKLAFIYTNSRLCRSWIRFQWRSWIGTRDCGQASQTNY
jgi:hypothetical protein